MFYADLAHVIGENYSAKVPFNSKLRESKDRWFNHLDKLRFETVTDEEFWLNYWSYNPCNIKPTEHDKKQLTHSSESALEDFHFCLCTSLKALIEADKEKLESTENLHQFYLLVKNEMLSRNYEGLTATDSFILDINKKTKGQLISMTESRKKGICPYCHSKDHIQSYGDKWKCTLCMKYFRKAN